MTNSEIISIIISKNPSNRISELRKVQILQLAARYGTADDIRAAYSAYGSFEFVSGALSYACEYADLEKIDVFIENNDDFSYSDLKWDLKGKYCESFWNYLGAMFPGCKVSRKADNPDLGIKYAGEAFKELPIHPISDEQRAEVIVKMYRWRVKSFGDFQTNSIYQLLTVNTIINGNIRLGKILFERGIPITEDTFFSFADPSTKLLMRLSGLDFRIRVEALKTLCDTAEKAGTKLVPDATLRDFVDTLCYPQFMQILLDKCDLKRFSKRDIIEPVIMSEKPELLQMLEERAYFNNKQTRIKAIEFAQANGYLTSYQWLTSATPRIIQHIAFQKKSLGKRTKDDPKNAKWFTHKGNTITGLSQYGIRSINENKVHTLTFPRMIDGVIIDTVDADDEKPFLEDVPSVNKIIVPDGFKIITILNDVQTVVFMSDESFFTQIMGRGIINVEIKNGNEYCTTDGVVFSKDGSELVYYPSGRQEKYTVPSHVHRIWREVFLGRTIEELIIPDSVETLGERVAWGSSIKRLDIAGSVKIIPDDAFRDCSALEEVILHEGLERIGRAAFQYCGAKEVVFPASLRTISSDAFKHSKSRFTFLSDDVYIGTGAFAGCQREGTNYSPIIEGKMLRRGYIT